MEHRRQVTGVAATRIQGAAVAYGKNHRCRIMTRREPPYLWVMRVDLDGDGNPLPIPDQIEDEPPATLAGAITQTALTLQPSTGKAQGHCILCHAPGESLVTLREHWECCACGESGEGPASWLAAIARHGINPARVAAPETSARHRAIALQAREKRRSMLEAERLRRKRAELRGDALSREPSG